MLTRKFLPTILIGASLTGSTLAADPRLDVSHIIGKTEAAAVLGEPVREPSPRSGDGADGYYSKCNYYSVRRGKSLVIRFQLPGPNAIAPQKELELLVGANGAMEKVTGVGDAAQMFVTAGDSGFASRVLMLYVAKGPVFITIGLSGFADDAIALEKAKTVAQKLLERF
ncbi:MAG TPA: hypothetical protein VIU85_02265 [Chthoniobacterales bacterium]